MPRAYGSRRRGLRSDHVEDPVVERRCLFCRRVHRKRLSETARGQVFNCSCGAMFSSRASPCWWMP